MRAVAILRNLDACAEEGEAIPWVLDRSPHAGLGPAAERMWRECDRGDWLIWLVSHEDVAQHIPESDRCLRLVACDCAEHVLHVYEDEYPGDTRPRVAIETARRYARRQAIGSEMAAARDAAREAARDAAREAARDAAREAAWAARDAARDVAVAAAREAARAARNAARDAAEAAQADIVRHHYPWTVVRRALEACS